VLAILEVALAFGDLAAESTAAARCTLVRIQQMLWRMTR
jgi:hypothetical protein